MSRYTAQQLTDLRAAIAEGVTKVSANGRMVEYRSLAEMRRLEAIMSAELEAEPTIPRRIYLSHRRA
jgi:roadblock/LC7 domain-containing protein